MKISLNNNYKNTTVEIQMGEYQVLIDREDLALFARFAWHPVKNKKSRTAYLYYSSKGAGQKSHQFHRVLLSAPKGMDVDHINGNGLDNRKSNLRIVTHQQNQSNMRKKINASSKYRGVSWRKDKGVWAVYVNYSNKTKNLGNFKSEIEAAHAYDKFLINNNIDKSRNFT